MWRALGTIPLLLVVAGCGSHGGTRPPTDDERAAIVAAAGRELRPLLRSRQLHLRVTRIAVARRDNHFAYVEAEPVNRAGRQVSETANLVLVQAGGEWIALLDGTDFAAVCSRPAPRAVIDLVCR